VLPDHLEGDPRQGRDETSEFSIAADASEDASLVLTMLSEFEKDADVYGSLKGTRAAQKVAVVAVGHVRTFILPGVYSSISTNLMGTFPGTADFFFVAHLGKYVDSWAHGAADVDVSSYLHAFNDSEEKAVTSVLDGMKEYPTHVEIHSGCSCHDLVDARTQFGTTGPDCESANGHLMQVLWMDHAFQQVERSGPYDIVVRIRPDVAVFEPFPWQLLSISEISYEQKRDFGMADWTFAFPFLFLKQTWPSVVDKFITQSKDPSASPDVVWHFHGREVNFPTVVVRSAGAASCKHVRDSALYAECLGLCSHRWFMEVH